MCYILQSCPVLSLIKSLEVAIAYAVVERRGLLVSSQVSSSYIYIRGQVNSCAGVYKLEACCACEAGHSGLNRYSASISCYSLPCTIDAVAPILFANQSTSVNSLYNLAIVILNYASHGCVVHLLASSNAIRSNSLREELCLGLGVVQGCTQSKSVSVESDVELLVRLDSQLSRVQLTTASYIPDIGIGGSKSSLLLIDCVRVVVADLIVNIGLANLLNDLCVQIYSSSGVVIINQSAVVGVHQGLNVTTSHQPAHLTKTS